MAPSVTDLPTDNPVQIQSADISQMTEELFTSMLDMELTPTPSQLESVTDEALQASVRINGEWNAELRVVAGKSLSESIACAMFAIESSELADEETLDALGEIANVIGGNIKGIVDRDCNLSIPCVGCVSDSQSLQGNCQAFNCAGEVLHVFLIES